MKKILFPTDFSEAASNAFQYAVALASEIGAKIDLAHVYYLPFADSTSVSAEYMAEMLDEKEKAIIERMKTFAGEENLDSINKFLPIYGLLIPPEILNIAKNKYDLLVMGTRGEHHSQVEKIIGSVTTHTITHAPCPVLAIPGEAQWKGIRHIAYATNFNPKDDQAVVQLISFAEELGAKVHFVHIETKADIGKTADSISLENYPYDFTDFFIINNPSVIEGMEQYLKEKEIELLALFSPERSLWERLFHSSFTKKMAFHSKTPILVLKG